MIEMKCNSCGGNLEVSPQDFLKVGEIVVQTCDTFRCPYCNSTFSRSEQFSLSINMNVEHANFVINTGGGAFVKGSINLGPGQDFVGRDKFVVIQKG